MNAEQWTGRNASGVRTSARFITRANKFEENSKQDDELDFTSEGKAADSADNLSSRTDEKKSYDEQTNDSILSKQAQRRRTIGRGRAPSFSTTNDGETPQQVDAGPTSKTETVDHEASGRFSFRSNKHVDERKVSSRIMEHQVHEVHFVGELLGAVGYQNRAVSCQWRIECGVHWSYLEGEERGQTQYCSAFGEDVSCWNHPIDVRYTGTSTQGWPRILLQLWETDIYGRTLSAGYGFTHLPGIPGNYNFAIPCWRPQGTLLEEMQAFFLGAMPQLADDVILFGRAWEDRRGLITIPCGQVRVTVNVVHRSSSVPLRRS